MKINLLQMSEPNMQKQSLNFKAVNLIQIPKAAFANPEDIKQCSDIFSRSIEKLTKDRSEGFFGALLALFHPKTAKTTDCLEYYSCFFAKCGMQQQNIPYSLNWFKQNSGLPIKEPLDNEFHSFHVYTKEHKDCVAEMLKHSPDEVFDCTRAAVQRYPRDKQMAVVYAAAKYGTEIDARIDKLITGTPVNKFKINCLDDLKGIIGKLDV